MVCSARGAQPAQKTSHEEKQHLNPRKTIKWVAYGGIITNSLPASLLLWCCFLLVTLGTGTLFPCDVCNKRYRKQTLEVDDNGLKIRPADLCLSEYREEKF